MTKFLKHLIKITEDYSIRSKIVYCEENGFLCCHVEPKDQIVSIKPYGCWYSWGPVWLQFLCRDKKWGIKRAETYASAHKLQINYSKILKLRKFKDFVDFTKKYGIACNKIKKYYGISPKAFEDKDYESYEYPYVIDWKKVAKKYNGIDIMLHWTACDKFYWYNGWDISGGCIWNFKSIEKVQKIR